ncbi:MAG: hypothetical protein ACETWQ_13285 [Phycisphaerae bacterium]
MNVSIYLQTAYEKKCDWTLGQNKPNSKPIQTQSNPILSAVGGLQNECKLTYNKGLQKKDDFAVQKSKPNSNPIQTQFKPNQSQSFLHFSCAQQFLANTIYSILPNSPRQTLAAVWGVKMGLFQGWFFSIGKMVYAAN